MTPTTCTTCGTPLPAVAADQRHPDRCATCAARASGDLGPAAPTFVAPLPTVAPLGAGSAVPGSVIPGRPSTVPAPYRPLITRTRLLEGIVVGVAMAAIAGVAWWAVVTLTGTEVAYGAIAVGILIGQAVLIGARKGGAGPALVAGLACLAALAVAEYFIQRTLAISNFGVELPLWLGLSTAKDVVWDAVKAEPITGAYWAVGVLAAVASAGVAGRRPIL